MNTDATRAPRSRLLLMSVGSLVCTALLECLDRAGRERFELIGLNTEASAANNFRMDRCYLSPPARDHGAMFALLDQLAQRHDPDLIVPTRDDDVVALAHWAHSRGWRRAMVGAPAMADVIRDKWSSFRWAQAKGLPFARSAVDAAGVAQLQREFGWPLVAKPRLGFGSNGVRMLLNDDHAAAALRAGDQVVQQPIAPAAMLRSEDLQAGMPLWFAPLQPGSALTLCLLDDTGSRFLAAWQSQHVRGAAVDTVLLRDDALEALALAYAQAAWQDGWRGLMNVQARCLAPGHHVPIELAGRFMGGMNALDRLGIPAVALVLRHYLPGLPAVPPPAPLWQARVVKQVQTLLVHDEDTQRLRATGTWDRPTSTGPAPR